MNGDLPEGHTRLESLSQVLSLGHSNVWAIQIDKNAVGL